MDLSLGRGRSFLHLGGLFTTKKTAYAQGTLVLA